MAAQAARETFQTHGGTGRRGARAGGWAWRAPGPARRGPAEHLQDPAAQELSKPDYRRIAIGSGVTAPARNTPPSGLMRGPFCRKLNDGRPLAAAWL